MTIVAEALQGLPDTLLADVYREADEDAERRAVLAEAARRDQADRLAAARGVLASIREEGEQAAYAQYRRAEEWCRGRLLSREGMAAGIRETDLWRMPADRPPARVRGAPRLPPVRRAADHRGGVCPRPGR